MRSLLSLAALAFLLAGCETAEDQQSATTEVLLAGAGFEIKMADTPERRSQVETLTQRRIVRHQRNGEAFYVYADAISCGCLYAGTEANYERYHALAQSSRAKGVQRLDAVTADPGAELNWAPWNSEKRPSGTQ